MKFDDWTGARPWADALMTAWRDAIAPSRDRPEGAGLDAALRECLDAGRPFCFLPSCDTIDRVRLRDQWEWGRWAASQYRAIRAQLTESK